jgi:hypothetical protein
MRYIRVPEAMLVKPPTDAIGLAADAKPEAMSFRKFAMSIWLDDDRAIDGGFVKQVRWAKVLDAFAAAVPGEYLHLEDEDYTTLLTIVKTPQRRLPPSISVQLLSFSQVVLDALDKLPAAVATNGAEATS